MFVSITYGGFVSAVVSVVVSAVPLRCLCGASAVPLRWHLPLRCVLFFCFCGASAACFVFLFLRCHFCFCGVSAEAFLGRVVVQIPQNLFLRCLCGEICFCGNLLLTT